MSISGLEIVAFCVSRCLLPFVLACTQSCSGQQSGAQCRAGSTQTIFLPLPCSGQQSGSTRLAYIIGTPSSLIFLGDFVAATCCFVLDCQNFIRRRRWYRVVPALCALLCTEGSILPAAVAGASKDSEARCEPVEVLEDCGVKRHPPSIYNMFFYESSSCS